MFYVYLGIKLLAVYTAAELRYMAHTDSTVAAYEIYDADGGHLTLPEVFAV